MCSTIKMGKKGSQGACVDTEFRVNGIGNLRVVDLSILPLIPKYADTFLDYFPNVLMLILGIVIILNQQRIWWVKLQQKSWSQSISSIHRLGQTINSDEDYKLWNAKWARPFSRFRSFSCADRMWTESGLWKRSVGYFQFVASKEVIYIWKLE